MTLWVEAYARSLVSPDGPWATSPSSPCRLAELLDAAEPADPHHLSRARRTAILAVLRGALMDLLATGDLERTTAAVHQQLEATVRCRRQGDTTLNSLDSALLASARCCVVVRGSSYGTP